MTIKKNQLIEALSVLGDDNVVIKGAFTHNREYSSVYSCSISSITISYSTEDQWSATIFFKEDKEENVDPGDVISISPTNPIMTKEKLIAALSILEEENPSLLAVFDYDDHWGSSYNADITGMEMRFTSTGVQAVIIIKESIKEAKAAA